MLTTILNFSALALYTWIVYKLAWSKGRETTLKRLRGH